MSWPMVIVLPKLDQRVHVVGDATNLEGVAAQRLESTGQIGPEFRSTFRAYSRFAVLGTEHHVDIDLGE